MSKLPAELIRQKRDGGTFDEKDIKTFVKGAVDGSWGDAQLGAMLMACLLRGLDDTETTSLTRAMTDSGDRLSWDDVGPCLDKHSTGGVGDKVSLLLAPIVAACGGFVPMISGRGLGHTGGTLDKLEAIPGYDTHPANDVLRAVVQDAGCAIVGATENLAPADARLYGIRDVTATVSSIPLITASILSKKLAAGLDALVMDVKVGNGAFMPSMADANALARSLVDVATLAGLPTRAWITDMDQVLGHSAGNGVEVREVIAALTGGPFESRLREVVVALACELLVLGGVLAADAAPDAVERSMAGGDAAERFARMTAGLGGPVDLLDDPDKHLLRARHEMPVPAPREGVVEDIDVRAVGLAIVALGGGRARASDAVDPTVGLVGVAGIGDSVGAGRPLAMLHASSRVRAEGAIEQLQAAFRIGDGAATPTPVLKQVLGAA